MPVQITCPNCKGQLRVPEDLFGKRVQCPTCEMIFTAAVEAPTPSARPVADRPRPTANVDDEVFAAPRREVRYLQPHRGSLILTFGILSLVICAPLGIAAWVMGNNDLAAIRRGDMDPTGEGNTQAGRICGMIASILMIAGCSCYALGFVGMALTGGLR